MRIRIIVILMLVPLFNATAFSQSKKENVLYDNLLRSINEYYDNYIIENHDRIDSTYIDLTGLPRGFKISIFILYLKK